MPFLSSPDKGFVHTLKKTHEVTIYLLFLLSALSLRYLPHLATLYPVHPSRTSHIQSKMSDNPHPEPIMRAYHRLQQQQQRKARSKSKLSLQPPSNSTLLKRRRASHLLAIISATRERAGPRSGSQAQSMSSAPSRLPVPKAQTERSISNAGRYQPQERLPVSQVHQERSRNRHGDCQAEAVIARQRAWKADTARYRAEIAAYHAQRAQWNEVRAREYAEVRRVLAKRERKERSEREDVWMSWAWPEEQEIDYFCENPNC